MASTVASNADLREAKFTRTSTSGCLETASDISLYTERRGEERGGEERRGEERGGKERRGEERRGEERRGEERRGEGSGGEER